MKINWRKFVVSAVVGSVVWSLTLTPYVIFVLGMDVGQYTMWLLMQFIIVPPIAPLVYFLTERVNRKILK